MTSIKRCWKTLAEAERTDVATDIQHRPNDSRKSFTEELTDAYFEKRSATGFSFNNEDSMWASVCCASDRGFLRDDPLVTKSRNAD